MAVGLHQVPPIGVQRPAGDVEAVSADEHVLKAALVVALCAGRRPRLGVCSCSRRLQLAMRGKAGQSSTKVCPQSCTKVSPKGRSGCGSERLLQVRLETTACRAM